MVLGASEMIRWFIIAFILIGLCIGRVLAADVQWNVFSIYDWSDYDENGNGRSIQYYGAGRTPEAGFVISKGRGYTRNLTFKGEYSNVGNNATFWALASADTVIDYDWMQNTTPLLDIGLVEYRSEGAFDLVNNQSAYIAMIGRDLGDPEGYYTGWVQIANNQGEIEILSSALADAALYVGSGATAGFAGPAPASPAPELTSGFLLVVGIASLALMRKRK